ncbi:MAG: cytochrome c biogenesis protein CcdA, partial [Geodermatophilaceae bacterium]|nr:cytochrome c biogenesis protein CcdA [Geodermatophilaceae bacterium]
MSQLVFAYGVGMLALVSPCGFTMLPAFLAYNIADNGSVSRSGTRRLTRALAVGLAVSLGFAGTFLISGLLVSAGLRSLVEAVPWFGVVVG